MTTTTHTGTATRTTAHAWRTWQDWAALVLGAYLALAPLWTTGAPTVWFVTLGVLVAAAALWCLATPRIQAAEWTLLVLGVVVFLTPWIAGVAGIAAVGWTAWLIGVVVAVLAGSVLYQRRA